MMIMSTNGFYNSLRKGQYSHGLSVLAFTDHSTECIFLQWCVMIPLILSLSES